MAGTARAAVDHALYGGFVLMALARGLPGGDHFAVPRRPSGSGSPLPVVVRTARDGADDTVTGRETGADDGMTVPFRSEEPSAPVRLRRRGECVAEAAVLSAEAPPRA